MCSIQFHILKQSWKEIAINHLLSSDHWTGNASGRFLHRRTVLKVSFKHILISLISFMGIAISMRLLYSTTGLWCIQNRKELEWQECVVQVSNNFPSLTEIEPLMFNSVQRVIFQKRPISVKKCAPYKGVQTSSALHGREWRDSPFPLTLWQTGWTSGSVWAQWWRRAPAAAVRFKIRSHKTVSPVVSFSCVERSLREEHNRQEFENTTG
jgi:hypothetical protein